MILVLIVYLAPKDGKQQDRKWTTTGHKQDNSDVKTRQQQDRDKTLLLLAAPEQQNIDTKITRLGKHIDNSE